MKKIRVKRKRKRASKIRPENSCVKRSRLTDLFGNPSDCHFRSFLIRTVEKKFCSSLVRVFVPDGYSDRKRNSALCLTSHELEYYTRRDVEVSRKLDTYTAIHKLVHTQAYVYFDT